MDKENLKSVRELRDEMYDWVENFEKLCKYAAELEQKKQAGEDVSDLHSKGEEYFAFDEFQVADLASQFMTWAQRVLFVQYHTAVDSVARDGRAAAIELSKYTYLKEDFFLPYVKK